MSPRPKRWLRELVRSAYPTKGVVILGLEAYAATCGGKHHVRLMGTPIARERRVPILPALAAEQGVGMAATRQGAERVIGFNAFAEFLSWLADDNGAWLAVGRDIMRAKGMS